VKKWHRYSGIVAAAFLLNLSVTGILLNHPSLIERFFTQKGRDFPHLITHIHHDPHASNKVWIGTEKGLYVSSDNGETVTKKAGRIAHSKVTDIYTSHSQPGLMLVSFSNHLLIESNDFGDTWARIPLPDSIEEVSSISESSNGERLIVTRDGVFSLTALGQVSSRIQVSTTASILHLVKLFHTGHIVSPLLVYLNDLSALLLLTLIVSGIVLFFRFRTRNQGVFK
jgi:hypothetical protein